MGGYLEYRAEVIANSRHPSSRRELFRKIEVLKCGSYTSIGQVLAGAEHIGSGRTLGPCAVRIEQVRVAQQRRRAHHRIAPCDVEAAASNCFKGKRM